MVAHKRGCKYYFKIYNGIVGKKYRGILFIKFNALSKYGIKLLLNNNSLNAI